MSSWSSDEDWEPKEGCDEDDDEDDEQEDSSNASLSGSDEDWEPPAKKVSKVIEVVELSDDDDDKYEAPKKDSCNVPSSSINKDGEPPAKNGYKVIPTLKMSDVEEAEERMKEKEEEKEDDEEVDETPSPLDGANNLTRKEKVAKFVEITATDEELAKIVLPENSWDLKKAVDDFFSDAVFSELRKGLVQGPYQEEGPMNTSDLRGFELSVMSWNIDGLDNGNLFSRMTAVGKIVRNVNPDILFLQEVVDNKREPIDRLQSMYNIYYSDPGCQYYTAILVSKMLEVKNHSVIHYRNTGMFRTLQIIEGSIGGMKIFLLNTHLESMKEHRTQRCAQFAFCMDKCRELIKEHPQCLLFFGGDLNLRDDEVSPLPPGMQDAWEAAGSEGKTKFTWDTQRNDNKQSRFNAKLRFDRLYYYANFNRVQFDLEGRQRIKGAFCFPSDHWAISTTFNAV